MLILFDHGAPHGVARALRAHTVITAKAKGWDQLSNGDLWTAAEAAGVDLLFTTDRNIRYQQNLAIRQITTRHSHGYAAWKGGFCTIESIPITLRFSLSGR